MHVVVITLAFVNHSLPLPLSQNTHSRLSLLDAIDQLFVIYASGGTIYGPIGLGRMPRALPGGVEPEAFMAMFYQVVGESKLTISNCSLDSDQETAKATAAATATIVHTTRADDAVSIPSSALRADSKIFIQATSQFSAAVFCWSHV
jgi:hypothetical protein